MDWVAMSGVKCLGFSKCTSTIQSTRFEYRMSHFGGCDYDHLSIQKVTTLMDVLNKYKHFVAFLKKRRPFGQVRSAPCMQEKSYSKKFPKSYNPQTLFDKDGYVHYRRRKTGINTQCLGIDLDNRLRRTLQPVTKYTAAPTKSSSSSAPGVNEIQNFMDARFVCPHEAAWRIFNFPIHFREQAVQILAVHLPDVQLISYHAR
ncbi:uncharacterized protein [Rutidosis leptorrhynchoides]|uniref:uncharacterized protein isoform X2 n=1 Tax=Rutidosis leptorrhynchoides TaxID=125765 RepID=UPI003A99295E